MHHTRLKYLLAAALLAAGASAAAQDKGLLRLVPGGDDGTVRSYVARCADGTRGTVTAAHDRQELCATAQGGKQRCNREWSLMQAGQYACNAPGAR